MAAYGCTRPAPPQPPAPKPSQVQVGTPVLREITDYEEFTGRTEAVKTVEVRAQVTGYLDKVLFHEGAEVKPGDPLYIIDQRTYQAEVDRAQANLVQAHAHLARLQLDYNRFEKLLPSRAISQEDFDKAAGDRDEAAAAVKVAEAALQSSRLNLDFTTVRTPIAGRISRQVVDPGNLIRANETPMTTIVSQDPIYVYFDVDERSMLRIRRLIQSGKVKSAREFTVKVQIALTDEQEFTHEGTIDFIDNRVDAMTGTLRMRAVVLGDGYPASASKPDEAGRLFSPGMFVRVRVPIGTAHQAILIPERALGSDQGRKFLYVVNDKREVVYRPVEIGAMHDGLRVIEEGLSLNDKVILSGLQRVRPGAVVEAKLADVTAGDAPAATSPATQSTTPATAVKQQRTLPN